MESISINEPRQKTDVRAVCVVAALVIVVAACVWYWVADSEWSEGYSVGYSQACRDTRAAIATRVRSTTPFYIVDLGISFHPVGDRTFSIYFPENKGRPAPVAFTAQGHRSGQ
jgi:hypothetical protein